MDTGASSHIINDRSKFKSFDSTFKPERHSMELADWKAYRQGGARQGRCTGMPHKQRGAPVCSDFKERSLHPLVPPRPLLSEAHGAKVFFDEGKDVIVFPDGTRFDIYVCKRMYYLQTECDVDDVCQFSYDIQTLHEVMDHCNYEDILKLQDVTEGMHIKGAKRRPDKECAVCIEGKFTQTRNRDLTDKVKTPLELVNTDLAGPVNNESIDGFKYMQSFTDVCTGAVFVYFLKAKSDAVQATEKYLADVAPYGTVKCIRSDNGTEFTNSEFQTLLRKNKIRHETSCPYSSHQNGTAEREGRTLFEMARCKLIDSDLPKSLWHYAIQEAAYTRKQPIPGSGALTSTQALPHIQH